MLHATLHASLPPTTLHRVLERPRPCLRAALTPTPDWSAHDLHTERLHEAQRDVLVALPYGVRHTWVLHPVLTQHPAHVAPVLDAFTLAAARFQPILTPSRADDLAYLHRENLTHLHAWIHPGTPGRAAPHALRDTLAAILGITRALNALTLIPHDTPGTRAIHDWCSPDAACLTAVTLPGDDAVQRVMTRLWHATEQDGGGLPLITADLSTPQGRRLTRQYARHLAVATPLIQQALTLLGSVTQTD